MDATNDLADGLSEDLYVDIESAIHQYMGHDGQSDEANDWVTDLMSEISPFIVRALTDLRAEVERLQAENQDLAKARQFATSFRFMVADHGLPPTLGGLLDQLLDLLAADPSESMELVADDGVMAKWFHEFIATRAPSRHREELEAEVRNGEHQDEP